MLDDEVKLVYDEAKIKLNLKKGVMHHAENHFKGGKGQRRAYTGSHLQALPCQQNNRCQVGKGACKATPA